MYQIVPVISSQITNCKSRIWFLEDNVEIILKMSGFNFEILVIRASIVDLTEHLFELWRLIFGS